MEVYISDSPEKTEEIGRTVATGLPDFTSLIALYGEMGAGKTAFVRGFASFFSPGSKVKSPTYTVVNEYLSGDRPVYHFDLYRLSGADELDSLGFSDYLERGICISEWSERLGEDLPDNTVKVIIEKIGNDSRKITVYSNTDGESI